MFSRLRPYLIAACILSPVGVSAAPIDEATSWLRSFETLTANFEQITQDGERSTGRILISRPGKMRLEYDGDDAPLVIVGAGSVAIFDPASNAGPTQYPLSMTPLGPILARNPDLAKSEMMGDALELGDEISIIAQDPDNPDYGSAQFFFSDGGVLKRWIMTSRGGDKTHLLLSDIETGMEMKSLPFSAAREAERRRPQR